MNSYIRSAPNVTETFNYDLRPQRCPSCLHCSGPFLTSVLRRLMCPLLYLAQTQQKFYRRTLYSSWQKGRQEIIFLREKDTFFIFSFAPVK